MHGGKVPTTTENLKDAAVDLKTMSGQICTQQWLKKLVKKALMILLPCSKALGAIEKHHEARYKAMLKMLKKMPCLKRQLQPFGFV